MQSLLHAHVVPVAVTSNAAIARYDIECLW
jgi:hypothetical protein